MEVFTYFIFEFSIQMAANVQHKIRRWLDSNHAPLDSEATAIPTEPQPLPLAIVLVPKQLLSFLGFAGEWFWINWASGNPKHVEFMKQNYPPNFTYQDFGPQLTMEFFNASWFADVIADSGAKYEQLNPLFIVSGQCIIIVTFNFGWIEFIYILK